LVVHGLDLLAEGERTGQVAHLTYEFPVPASRRVEVQAAALRFLAETTHLVYRPGRAEPVDLRASVDSVELDEQAVRFRLRATRTAGAQPREILQVLGLSDLENAGQFLTRTAVEMS
jgi:hypothetical protein